MNSRENSGYNPDKDNGRKIKVIKKNDSSGDLPKPIKIEFVDDPVPQEDKGDIKDLAAEFRLAVKGKEDNRKTAEDRARKDFNDLFNE